jgi:hypothetical protein
MHGRWMNEGRGYGQDYHQRIKASKKAGVRAPGSQHTAIQEAVYSSRTVEGEVCPYIPQFPSKMTLLRRALRISATLKRSDIRIDKRYPQPSKA